MIRNNELALTGLLRSPSGGESMDLVVGNNMPIPLDPYWVDFDGRLKKYGRVAVAGTFRNLTGVRQAWLFRSALTGSFVTVVTAEPQNHAVVDWQSLCALGEVGALPQPTASRPLPPDSPKALVAVGVLPNGNLVEHAQFWKRGADSYMLAAGERKTVSTTVSDGVQDTSTTQESLAATVSASVSGGWGAVSASLSASLSHQSSSLHSHTITQQTTRFESVELVNESNADRLFLRWQLIDVVTVHDKEPPHSVLATVVTGQSPVLVAGPYDVSGLPSVE